jgi:hypothetical protein
MPVAGKPLKQGSFSRGEEGGLADAVRRAVRQIKMGQRQRETLISNYGKITYIKHCKTRHDAVKGEMLTQFKHPLII